ncbi:FkbM family methyltransferase [Rhodoblastus sphagnicola]|uniref:FkbM family methyltransferase n=1 Tax=Rhodoblastus sphagnicola TaxID=333368 RepID=A0A2S6NDU1_9HYPH|nr:FkbM family methyltransferase [Rhodoblastus sphagnicola]MBB4198512.1 FkbM family methyltransferase [Rhodoblastus sphagnicola]PPQ32771.1 FkbM family methyltransferase [Rhodoblastus sphagnicola]
MAESNVDLIVREHFFKNADKGIFLEVGAAHPDWLSVSASFRAAGWRIIPIEPNPEFCRLHRQRGYEILEYACGDHDQDDVSFTVVDTSGVIYDGAPITYESYSSLGMRGDYLKQFHRDAPVGNYKIMPISVKMRRLDGILAAHAADVTQIDIVSVDVEGWELEVMKGLDMDRFKPKVLVIENLFNASEYREFFAERGYQLWNCLAPNDIYVRTDAAL